MKNKIKIGVAGLGPNGLEHLVNYRNHPNAEVAAVCDVNEKLAGETAGRYNIAHIYTALDDMLEQKDIDLIAVCAPNPFHGEYTIKSLEAGKHVFVEKPMALELESLERIVKLWRKTGLTVTTGFILRFNPVFQLTRHLIREGMLGEIFYVESDYIHDLRGYPHLENPFGSDGVHAVDLLRWYVGDVTEVQAYGNRMIWPELEDPATVAIYKFKSGCIGKATVLWTPVGPRPKAFNTCVYGSKATIVRDEICLTGSHKFMPLHDDIAGHPYAPEDKHLVDCLVQEKEPLVNCLEGAKSTAACLVVKDALKHKKPVLIPQFEN